MSEATIIDLTPSATGKPVLGPETRVVVINRGRETLVRKFDALDYSLHSHTVGLMRMPYGAAQHFQKHTTVPGTRNAFSGAEQSFLGIMRTDEAGWPEQIAIDPPEWCEPFTAEQCEAFGQRVEALLREDPDDQVQSVAVSGAVASGRIPVGRGQSKGRKVAFSTEGVTADGSKVAREDVLSSGDETAAERVERLNAEAGD